MKTLLVLSLGSAMLFATAFMAAGQNPSAAERAAALAAATAASQAVLRQYEWVETTVVTLKGEQKSRKQERCYYGAEGGVQKVAIVTSPEPEKKRGLRGRIVEQKKEELTDYIAKAVALVKTYVPPSPARIQATKDAGNVSVELLEPGKKARLNFKNYEKPGDNLGVEVDLANNRPLAIRVGTYLDDASDAVTLEVRMAQLGDGAVFPAKVTLNATAKKLTVTVENSGYRKTSP